MDAGKNRDLGERVHFDNYQDDFYSFTRDLVSFYKNNNITPVIESDFSSIEKLESVYSFLEQ